jgi:biotin synthase
MENLAEEIICGRRLTRNDNLKFLLTTNLEELCNGANKIRQELCGEKVDLCTIINGRSGKCSENCKFCAQSGHHNTNVKQYDFLDPNIILRDCKRNEANGVHRYSIVTAGRSLTGADFDKAVQAYKIMHEECSVNLCASHGLLSKEEFIRLKEVGVTMYHANIETSRNNFPNICTTHSYEDKIDMAISLSELEVMSIPINVLMPIKGTPLGNLERISDEDILRTIAIFRYLNPTAYIRMAAGRTYFSDGGTQIFLSGANATITGDMLTTVGNNTEQDKIMITKLGFNILK